MSQVVSLDETQIEQLATYMGHRIIIHRQYYRLPEDTLQIAKVSKLLMAMDKGVTKLALDNINVDATGNFSYPLKKLGKKVPYSAFD